eukprot:TRINITY_DN470_c0_g1_i4.p1 TRINITY_DN470_c0_g1~~TRINITY_DN470_c0_g1_i4.p1  ORF type:complete len:691 (-),score=92.55 TRINITY_DN470_c0_g1_i4:1426-3498(-)
MKFGRWLLSEEVSPELPVLPYNALKVLISIAFSSNNVGCSECMGEIVVSDGSRPFRDSPSSQLLEAWRSQKGFPESQALVSEGTELPSPVVTPERRCHTNLAKDSGSAPRPQAVCKCVQRRAAACSAFQWALHHEFLRVTTALGRLIDAAVATPTSGSVAPVPRCVRHTLLPTVPLLPAPSSACSSFGSEGAATVSALGRSGCVDPDSFAATSTIMSFAVSPCRECAALRTATLTALPVSLYHSSGAASSSVRCRSSSPQRVEADVVPVGSSVPASPQSAASARTSRRVATALSSSQSPSVQATRLPPRFRAARAAQSTVPQPESATASSLSTPAAVMRPRKRRRVASARGGLSDGSRWESDAAMRDDGASSDAGPVRQARRRDTSSAAVTPAREGVPPPATAAASASASTVPSALSSCDVAPLNLSSASSAPSARLSGFPARDTTGGVRLDASVLLRGVVVLRESVRKITKKFDKQAALYATDCPRAAAALLAVLPALSGSGETEGPVVHMARPVRPETYAAELAVLLSQGVRPAVESSHKTVGVAWPTALGGEVCPRACGGSSLANSDAWPSPSPSPASSFNPAFGAAAHAVAEARRRPATAVESAGSHVDPAMSLSPSRPSSPPVVGAAPVEAAAVGLRERWVGAVDATAVVSVGLPALAKAIALASCGAGVRQMRRRTKASRMSEE